jgi:hypothetical protein
MVKYHEFEKSEIFLEKIWKKILKNLEKSGKILKNLEKSGKKS